MNLKTIVGKNHKTGLAKQDETIHANTSLQLIFIEKLFAKLRNMNKSLSKITAA